VRRQLTSAQKAIIGLKVLPMLEAGAKERQNKEGERGGEGGRENKKDETLTQLAGEGFRPKPASHHHETMDVAARLARHLILF